MLLGHSVLTISGPRSGPRPGLSPDNRVLLAACLLADEIALGWPAYLGRLGLPSHVLAEKRGGFIDRIPNPTTVRALSENQ
jgi:hypothetical protein